MVLKQAVASPMPERRKLETILTENKIVSEEQLQQIVHYAHAVGIDLHEAVLQKKVAPTDAVMMAYSESIGLPFVHLADVSVDEEIAAQVAPMTVRQYSFVPLSIDHGHVLLAATKPLLPDVAEELRITFGLPVRCMICTPAELNAAITKYYPRGGTQIIKAEQAKVPVPLPDVKKQEPVEPMNDEEKRDRLLKSFVAFNFSFAFVCFTLYSLQIPRGIQFQLSWLALFGVIGGSLAAFVTWKKLSR